MFSNSSDAGPYFLAFLIFVLLALACVSWRQPRAIFSLARWSYFVPSASETPDGFYTRLYGELQSRLEQKQLPFSAVGFGPRHMFSTRSIFGARPVYLAIRYQHLTYYVYAAPAPNGLFVSSWLFSRYTLWEDHPVLKWVLFWRLYQMTLFQFDVLELFHGAVHHALTDVIDSYREAEGLQPLAEYEKRPALNSYYARLKQGTLPPAGYAVPMQPPPLAPGGVLPIHTDPVRSPEDDFGLHGAASRPIA